LVKNIILIQETKPEIASWKIRLCLGFFSDNQDKIFPPTTIPTPAFTPTLTPIPTDTLVPTETPASST